MCLCQESAQVRVLDAKSYAPVKTIEVGAVPRGFSLSPKGDRLFVANSWDDTISRDRHEDAGSDGDVAGGG